MPKPKKEPGCHFEGHQITLPPGLWDEVKGLVGKGNISLFIQRAIEERLALSRIEKRLDEHDKAIAELRAALASRRADHPEETE